MVFVKPLAIVISVNNIIPEKIQNRIRYKMDPPRKKMEFDTSGGGAEANKTPNSLQIASTSTSMKSNPTAAAETSSSHSTTTTSRHNDAPATISNKNLGDLRREREERAVTNGRQLNNNQLNNNQFNKTRDTSPKSEERSDPNKSVTVAVTIDLTSDNDEDDDDYAASVALA